MRVRALALIMALAALAPATTVAAAPAAGAQPGGGAIPAEAAVLAGSWFDGSISSIQFYDRDTGVFADPNGEGFTFILEPDGTYREGAVISNTQYSCSMRLLGENQGTWTADATTLVLDQAGGSISITNTCGDSGIYAATDEADGLHLGGRAGRLRHGDAVALDDGRGALRTLPPMGGLSGPGRGWAARHLSRWWRAPGPTTGRS